MGSWSSPRCHGEVEQEGERLAPQEIRSLLGFGLLKTGGETPNPPLLSTGESLLVLPAQIAA